MNKSMFAGVQQPPTNVNIDPTQLATICCQSCNGKLFKQAHILKRVPKFMVGAPSDVPIAFPVWRCTNCGTVLVEFIPDGIIELEEDDEKV